MGTEITVQALTAYGCYDSTDLFEMMERGMRAKIRMMHLYPAMAAFAVKAFYEKNPEIHQAIAQSYQKHFNRKALGALSRIDPEDFIPGLNLKLMYREMYLASEGYLWEMLQQKGTFDVDALERDFSEMLAFWKHIYLRKEQESL